MARTCRTDPRTPPARLRCVVGDADLLDRAADFSFGVPGTASPATSPFTSARNTGTPIRD
jgi:hypothetical protein